jgi:hypothetical protein
MALSEHPALRPPTFAARSDRAEAESMTLKRRRLVIGLFLIPLIGGAITVWLIHEFTRSPINEKNFAKIHEGMTLAEVEAILGPSIDERRQGPHSGVFWRLGAWKRVGPDEIRYWVTEDAQIGIRFVWVGDSLQVDYPKFSRLEKASPGLIGKMLAFAKDLFK